jgi:acetyl esterase
VKKETALCLDLHQSSNHQDKHSWKRPPTRPYLADLGPIEGRKVVDSVQDGDIPAPAADTEDLTIPGGPQGDVSVKIYRPAGASGTLPVVIFTHGAGWVFGDAHTPDRLVRELTVRSGATVFVNYGLSPEHV